MPLFETVIQEKPPVVLDMGSAYTKLGFAAEPYPRIIIPSEAIVSKNGQTSRVLDYDSKEILCDKMVDYFQMIFFKHLLVSPKERKIVILDNVLKESLIRETLANVLFRHFEIASLLFVPTHLAAISSLGISTGVVVDIGYNETTVIPIYSGIQLLQAYQDQSFGGKMIHKDIKQQLVFSGVEIDYLNDNVLEDIKVKTCFVTSMERANMYRTGNPPVPPPDIEYQILDKEIITIPGALRETVLENMFVVDNERASLAHLILNAILNCPKDLRTVLAENILVIGGTGIIMGLLPRLKAELNFLIKSNVYQDKLFIKNFKFHKTVGRQNCAAWLGGSIYGATDLVSIRALSKEVYFRIGRVPEWINLIDNRLPVL